MTRKSLTHVHKVKKHKKHISLGLLSVLFILGISFVTAKNFPVYSSELNFKEYSIAGESAGSVVPASCVSGVQVYTHPSDMNFDGTIDSGCVPVCATGQILQTTNQYRCYHTAAATTWCDTTSDNGGCTTNGPYFAFSSWQASIPSCSAGNKVATDGVTRSFPAGVVQTKNIYSCVNLPSVNLNFQ
jgi:hypothetical protein